MSKKCPKCDNEITKYHALSRRDNKTKICSNCGTTEAMEDFTMYKEWEDHVDRGLTILPFESWRQLKKEVEKIWDVRIKNV